MLNREIPDAPAVLAFTETEMTILDKVIKDKTQIQFPPPLERYTIKLAQLGGYMGNKKTSAGEIAIWSVLIALTMAK